MQSLFKAHLPCAHPLKMTFSRSSKFAYIHANSLLVVVVIIIILYPM